MPAARPLVSNGRALVDAAVPARSQGALESTIDGFEAPSRTKLTFEMPEDVGTKTKIWPLTEAPAS
jgi:hypothetical protein